MEGPKYRECGGVLEDRQRVPSPLLLMGLRRALQRGLTTRSVQNVLEAEETYTVNVSKTKRYRAMVNTNFHFFGVDN